VSLYGHLFTKHIQITYNITYKGSLDFGIPGVISTTEQNNDFFAYLDKFGAKKLEP